VLSALEKHDENLARAAMSEHLAAGAVPLIEHLVSRGVVAEARRPTPRQPRRSTPS
ncbi:MAG: GntR family transcriptional regulator, partial [Mycobacterium sp.]